ncbi:MAG: 23S rRNA (pseudouridine(1915)-N(3))-methyltransferase RlmH [Oscillospiraceae bacterium]|nr:23S rRNA (pseudouridine(1915)-N(3))-methyltransferase RlmH [Oscillospiraceae bacterium]
MLVIKLICVGKMREKYYIEAFEEYRKRLGAYCRLECAELTEQRLTDNPSPGEIAAALEREGAEILRNIPADAFCVALCVEGKERSSEDFAALFRERELSGKPKLCFLVGGSYGMSETVKSRADLKLSMSKMTFPHHLARVMLAEQIYRAFKIGEGSRYHK